MWKRWHFSPATDMDCKLCSVALDRIRTDDHTFRITTASNKPDLAASISAVGLLQPPFLLPIGKEYVTVCGFRRIAAWRHGHHETIPARLLPENHPRFDCAAIAIIDNAAQRSLNIVEQSRAIALIDRYAAGPADANRLAGLTNLPTDRRAKNRIKPVAAMPLDLQHAILEGSVALPVALGIDRLPRGDATRLCDFFRLLNTGLNVQRELFGLICDISNRDDLPIDQLLAAPEVRVIADDADTPLPQRVHRLRRLFKQWRFPELTAAQKRFGQQLKSLKLPPFIQFQPPPFFEGASYRLTMTIASRRQLASLQTEIEKLAAHPNLLPD
jgi:hypothetical protein